jgi:hypothetical protein
MPAFANHTKATPSSTMRTLSRLGPRLPGRRIAIEIKDEDYGGRDFSCYDLEGHLWSFGTYHPW